MILGTFRNIDDAEACAEMARNNLDVRNNSERVIIRRTPRGCYGLRYTVVLVTA
jgi:hypothetical protein